MSPVAIEWESADSAPAAVPEPDDDADDTVELVGVGVVAGEGALVELLDDPQPAPRSAAPSAQATQSLGVESMPPD